MYATVLHGPGDIRYESVDDPRILLPTDAIIQLSATCICGSDLWPYRGVQAVGQPMHMGHEYCGVVVEIGPEVRHIRPGQFVVGSFCLSDNTCPHCRFGFQSSCVQREFMSGAQAPYARVPLADGTLVATAEMPDKHLIPHLLAVSDVLGTGWYGAVAANVREGETVVVVGDGSFRAPLLFKLSCWWSRHPRRAAFAVRRRRCNNRRAPSANNSDLPKTRMRTHPSMHSAYIGRRCCNRVRPTRSP